MARKATKHDPTDEGLPTSTTPLLGGSDGGRPSPSRNRRRTYVKGIAIGALGLAFVAIAIIGLFSNGDDADRQPLCKQRINATLLARARQYCAPVSRGKPHGVSEKSNHALVGNGIGFGSRYPWTNNMLSFQRTGFHFQPEKNWMNDPNGPMYYNGYYHFFYQYNPGGAIWGSPIVWGHAVSEDFIHWTHLPIALAADQWYDVNGVWSGSTTILPDGQIILLYTGSSNESAQQQNLAYPKNLSDPLLVEWVKYPGNPILTAPKGVDKKDFRDPTTAWLTSEGKWRITIGSKVNRTGVAFVYETKDFQTYKLLPSVLHAVRSTGMWECVDFYPVSLTSNNGLDPSTNGPEVKHVMKVSLDDDRHDYYSVGTYNESANTWKPDNPEIDVGIGIRYDYGVFYASKTFYDQKKQRRILWGWISESDSESADVMKGWASIQGVPRTLVLDKKTGNHLLQWPVEETEGLRFGGKEFNSMQVEAGKVIPLVVESASQIDIVAEFDIDKAAVEMASGSDEEFSCGKSSGSAQRGSLGPFGILVLTDQKQMEQTPVYFYVFKTSNGTLKTSFCTDQSRSSIASDVSKEIYGSYVPVLDGEKLSVRIVVDHSIVESFAQGGRAVITSRVYPTGAIYGNAQVFVFNNATDAGVMASVKIWQMNSTSIHPNDKNDVVDNGPCIE